MKSVVRVRSNERTWTKTPKCECAKIAPEANAFMVSVFWPCQKSARGRKEGRCAERTRITCTVQTGGVTAVGFSLPWLVYLPKVKSEVANRNGLIEPGNHATNLRGLPLDGSTFDTARLVVLLSSPVLKANRLFKSSSVL